VHFGEAQAQISERPVEPKRHIEARVVFEIVAGEATGEGDLHIAEIRPHETAAAACIVCRIAERAAFKAKRESRPQAITEPGKRPIFLEGSAVRGIGREK